MPPKVSGEPAMFSDMDSGGPWEQQYFHSFFAKVNSLEQQPDDSPGFFAFDLDKLPELLQRALLKRFVNKEELSDAEKKEIASYGDSAQLGSTCSKLPLPRTQAIMTRPRARAA